MRPKFLLSLMFLSSLFSSATNSKHAADKVSVGTMYHEKGYIKLQLRMIEEDLSVGVNRLAKNQIVFKDNYKGLTAEDLKLLEDYLKKAFEINVDNKCLELKLEKISPEMSSKGSDHAIAVVEASFACHSVSTIKSIKLKDALLIEVVPNQINVLNVDIREDNLQTLVFKSGKETSTLFFN